MSQSSGYYYPDSFDHADLEHLFSVYSCGCYKPAGGETFHTYRPAGRCDYQLLYVADGAAYFQLSDGLRKAGRGDAVLYHPGQPQDYTYTCHLYTSAEPPMKLDTGSAKNTPSVPKPKRLGSMRVRGMTMMTLRKIEKKTACLALPRATKTL